MKGSIKREQLIQVGSEIIVKQGFNAASLNQILSTAGVPKGSFYYYFASKEEFGLAIIDGFAAKYQDKLQQMLEDEQFPPLKRLRNYFESGVVAMENCDCSHGCLMGNLAQELSAQNELFRDRLSRVFADWERCFIQCLRAACEAGEIEENIDLADLAKFILSSWEGAILQAKVTKSILPMENFIEILFKKVLAIESV